MALRLEMEATHRIKIELLFEVGMAKRKIASTLAENGYAHGDDLRQSRAIVLNRSCSDDLY